MSILSEAIDDQTYDRPVGSGPEPVEVRRNGALAGGIGVVASVVAIAYLARAAGGGSLLDWVLAVAMGAVGAAYLAAFVDARTPLLVADVQGVRIRLGRTWRGVPWDHIDHVEHTPRHGLFRDGRLVLHVQDSVDVFERPGLRRPPAGPPRRPAVRLPAGDPAGSVDPGHRRR